MFWTVVKCLLKNTENGIEDDVDNAYAFAYIRHRGGPRAAATSTMERFVIIVNGFQPLTIIAKRSILDVAAALDPPLRHS